MPTEIVSSSWSEWSKKLPTEYAVTCKSLYQSGSSSPSSHPSQLAWGE